mgnify:CR=1 FL=1
MKKRALIITIIVSIILIILLGITIIYQLIEGKTNNTNGNIQSGELENQQNENLTENIENIENINNSVQNNEIPVLNEIKEEPVNQEPTETSTIAARYFYNQLDQYGKIIYNKLRQNKEKLKTGTYVFDYGTEFNTLLHSEKGEESLNTAFQSAWNAFLYDENDLFYIDMKKMNLSKESHSLGEINTYYVSIGPGNNKNYLKENFQTQEQIQSAQKYIDNILKQIKEQTKKDTNAQKAKKVHDWLISVIEYDTTEQNINKYDIYGALHDKKAVCEGYARSFKYIMEQIGVPCVMVAGTARNSQDTTEVHAWNYVQVDEKWYAVDVTWDDPVIVGEGILTEEQKHKYFLKGSAEFLENHTEGGILSDGSMKFTFPTLSETNYNINPAQ